MNTLPRKRPLATSSKKAPRMREQEAKDNGSRDSDTISNISAGSTVVLSVVNVEQSTQHSGQGTTMALRPNKRRSSTPVVLDEHEQETPRPIVIKPLPDEKLRCMTVEITENDVLCGRGGATNHHKGNIAFRTLVSANQPKYVKTPRLHRSDIAKSIVAEIREKNGRFLKKVGKNIWEDIGDTKATAKASQALREGLAGNVRHVVRHSGVGTQALKRLGFEVNPAMEIVSREKIEERLFSPTR